MTLHDTVTKGGRQSLSTSKPLPSPGGLRPTPEPQRPSADIEQQREGSRDSTQRGGLLGQPRTTSLPSRLSPHLSTRLSPLCAPLTPCTGLELPQRGDVSPAPNAPSSADSQTRSHKPAFHKNRYMHLQLERMRVALQ